MEFHKMSAREIARGVKEKRFTAEEVARESIERIKTLDKKYNSVVTLCEDEALAAARRVDEAIARGEDPGPLAGVPFAVKDNFCTNGIETTCCSNMLKGWVPQYDATAVKNMKEAGAVLVGKTNMDEFAMGSTTESSIFGPTLNPRDTGRVPGGSSGGSAAVVAAGLVPVSLGSDTGGSVRQPAAFCGVQGMKPSYGQISRYGIVAYASSLDQVGPMTKTVEDAALLMDVLAGHDPLDATSLDVPPPRLAGCWAGMDPARPLAGMTLGLPKEYFGDGLDPEVRALTEQAAKRAEALGATLREVSLPHAGYGIPTYYICMTAEVSANLARFDGVRYGLRVPREEVLAQYRDTRAQGFGAEVKRRVLLGTFVLSSGYYDAYYNRAQKVRTLIRRDFGQAFAGCDLLLAPVTPEPAWPLGVYQDDPIRNYLSDVLTVGANLAGCCAIAIPAGKTAAGKPVGLQLLGPNLGEATLFRAAHALELR